MKRSPFLCAGVAGLAASGLLLCSEPARAQVSNGADVIVGDIPNISNNTPAAGDAGFDSFAIGTTSCNRGNTELLWYSSTNQHPVIGQNLFRLHNGRFEQIGQAWLKHGFTALQGGECAGDPGFPYASCANSGTGSRLGLGCSDPYSSGLNNGQSGLGPKWQVNAAKGVFPYPFDSPAYTGNVARRLRVRLADLDPTTYSGARYFVEGQYVVPDDAAFGNGTNSASYREVVITGASPDFSMGLAGPATVREKPGIEAWKAFDPAVQLVNVDVPNDGRFILACKVTGPVGGLYTYEYALQNLNSDRSAGSFSVPKPAGAAVSSIGFKDVEYHSGERNDTNVANPGADDWASSTTSTSVTWAGAAYNGTPATYTISGANSNYTQSFLLSAWNAGTGNDHTANVLRWGTLFNFRFQTTVAPALGQIQVGLWRPGTPNVIFIPIQTPGGATTGTPATGPCCVGQTCSITTSTACAGTFGTVGATCNPDPCVVPPSGTCCTAGACTFTQQVACPTGTWTQGGACSPNPCPQPTGACCVGTSCSTTTAAACTGVYLGNSIACTTGICAGNDTCATAIALCDGVPVTGNNANATNDITVCASSRNGIWYRYTPATSGSVSLATSAPSGSGVSDTVLSLHASCTTSASLACDDDGGPGNFSLITFNMTAGTTYYIRLATWGNSTTGLMDLLITGGGGQGCGVPTGACCVGSTCTSTTQLGCQGTWTSGATCSPTSCQTSGSCCVGELCSVGFQTACSGIWTAGGSCSPNLCAPANDLCANRPGIGSGATPFTTVNATTDGIAHNPACLFFGNDNLTNDVWFNFPVTFTGSAIIDTCGASFDTKLAVYLGYGCADYESRLIACSDDDASCGTGSRVVIDNLVPGDFLTIRVGGYNGATGAGNLNVTAVPLVEGACCTGTACAVTTSAGCTGNFQGLGSACGPTGNPTTCCRANINGTAGLTVQDIFDFLAAYFDSSPEGDFNLSGSFTVQDIFDFLAAYFNGCPG